MTATDWFTVLEPWWPILAAAGVGLVLVWLLRSRRKPEADERATDQPTAFPARPAVEPTPTDPASVVTPAITTQATTQATKQADAPEPFAQFESKLREWQAYASSDAAVLAADQPSIDDWDDLMDIEGIDLGLARFLYAESIHTFDQIAAMTAEQLREVLDRAGPAYGNVDPAAWPESARRAALSR